MTLSVPGKTFLVGEYLAIAGGPSILLATSPRFYLQTKSVESGEGVGVAAGSPAGRFLARHPSVGGFEFRDPHRGKGGLGASSAQFALAYVASLGVSAVDPERFDWQSLLEEYRACAWNGEGHPPSGADVVTQLTGGVTWFDGVALRARSLRWMFQDLSFTLIRTGHKLATHEHLRRAQAAPHEALRAAVRQATTSFETRDESGLVQSVRGVREALGAAGLCAAATETLLRELDQTSWALAAKGCGAMGADVILVLHRVSESGIAAQWAAERGLELCGRLEDLGAGLMVEP